MNNVIWRANGQAYLMGAFSPRQLLDIACEMEARMSNNTIDGTGWAEAAFVDDVDPSWRGDYAEINRQIRAAQDAQREQHNNAVLRREIAMANGCQRNA